VTVAALYFGREILLPVTLAVLLSFVLSPLVTGLRKLHIPDVIAVVFSVTLAIGVIAGVATLVGTHVVDLAGDLPKYQTTIENKVRTLHNATLGQISALASRLQTAVGQPEKPKTAASAAAQKQDKSRQEPVPVEPPPDPLSVAQRALTPVLHPLATAAIVFIVAVFVLLQRDDLRDRIIRLFGTRDLHRSTVALDDAAKRLSRFFLTQLCVNIAFGVIIATGLYFIGLPSPLLWGTMAGLLRFVPYIGSYVAAAGPILLAAAVEPGWDLALWVSALFLATEPIIGQFIEPLLYGRSTGLSPISVVISALFWGWLWGPVGLIISTPLTLCLVVMGQHVEQLEFLQVALGDRPALLKSESFYQRLLAEDEDDLQEQAEEMLKEISLASYYDDVAMPGLELAAARPDKRGACALASGKNCERYRLLLN
jgi:predicted PurR-regulated permease PerM